MASNKLFEKLLSKYSSKNRVRTMRKSRSVPKIRLTHSHSRKALSQASTSPYYHNYHLLPSSHNPSDPFTLHNLIMNKRTQVRNTHSPLQVFKPTFTLSKPKQREGVSMDILKIKQRIQNSRSAFTRK